MPRDNLPRKTTEAPGGCGNKCATENALPPASGGVRAVVLSTTGNESLLRVSVPGTDSCARMASGRGMIAARGIMRQRQRDLDHARNSAANFVAAP
jgi:hypothetical protein